MPTRTTTCQEYGRLKELDDGYTYHYMDCQHRAKCRMLTYALYVCILLLLITSISTSVLVWNITAQQPVLYTEKVLQHDDDHRMTSLGRDSRYMTTNHSADDLWDIMLEDHLGEYVTSDGPFDRGEFSMYALCLMPAQNADFASPGFINSAA